MRLFTIGGALFFMLYYLAVDRIFTMVDLIPYSPTISYSQSGGFSGGGLKTLVSVGGAWNALTAIIAAVLVTMTPKVLPF